MFPRQSVKHVPGQIRQESGGIRQGAIPGPGPATTFAPSPCFCPFPLHAITDAGDRTYGGTVVSATYRDLFATVATAAGALTGLLFVALSLVPRRASGSGLSVIQQVRAAAAWLAFTNALAVALFGLVPGTNVGYPALVLGVIGVAFTVAGSGQFWLARPRPVSSCGKSGLWSCSCLSSAQS